jgi:ABC-type nitrate/sulfonate/bicarbonate transport system substrate-binding protein
LAGVGIASQFACAPRASTLRVALDWGPGSEHAGLLRAIRLGEFAAKGIPVSFTPGGANAPNPLVTLSAGRSDIVAANWLSTVDAINKGNDFVVLGANFPQNPGGVLSRPSKPIRTAADIVGKRMLVEDPSLSAILDGMLAFAGVKGEYKSILTGFSADPLFAGDGDGYLCFVTNQPIVLENMGLKPEKDFVLASFHQLGYDIPEGLIVVSRSTLTHRRAALVDFLEVLLRSWNAHAAAPRDDIQSIVQAYGQDYGLDLKTELEKDRLQEPLMLSPDGRRLAITDGQVDKMLQLAGLTGRAVPVRQKIFDASVLAEAAARVAHA